MARRELAADAGEIGLQSGPSHRCTLSQELYHTRRGHLPQPTLHSEWSSKPNELIPLSLPVPIQFLSKLFKPSSHGQFASGPSPVLKSSMAPQ